MKTVEYGNTGNRTIMLLHGGGLSWWNYRAEAEKLKDRYHVVLPVLDGHSGSDRSFTTIESNAEELLAYIDSHCDGRLAAISGLSLGGQILTEMLSRRNDVCGSALIESALVIPMKTTAVLVKPMLDMSYGLIKREWFARLQFKSLKMRSDLYDDYYRDSCRIKKDDMINFLTANASYQLKPELAATKAKTIVAVGSREQPIMCRSAALLQKTIPNSRLEVMADYYHGQFSLNHPDDFVSLLTGLVEDRQ